MRSAISAVLLALLAQAASASAAENRIEFIALHGETRVARSEVCFSPADSKDVFFGRFLATDDVRCLSADAVIQLPRGLFNVFARNGSTLIDSHPTFIDNEQPGEPGYRSVALSLHPAATLDVSEARAGLRNGEWLAVYLTNEARPESLASVHPVPRGDTKIVVPAEMPLVPMVVRRGAIVRVGKPMQLRAGETKSLPKMDQWGSGRDVVALLRTDALTAPGVPPQAPVVELVAELDGGTAEPLRPMFAPRGAGRFEGSLAIFKDVPPGTHQIRLSGEGWLRDESTVTIPSDATPVTAAGSLLARIAATVEVRASIGELAVGVGGVQCPDDEKPTPEPMPAVRLLRCAGQRCTTVRERPFEPQQANMVVSWPDLEPGVYVAEVGYRFLSERSAEVEARAGRAETLTVALQTGTVTGRVKHGGLPVQAVVSFLHSVTPALSDESGNYTALVAKEPRRSLVRVRICGGGAYQYRLEAPIDKILDIDIPKNELVVRVVDEQGRPLAGASVLGGPKFPEGDGVSTELPFAPTDSAGETRLENVVTDAVLQLCAGLQGYAEGCAAERELGDRVRHRVEITLRPQAAMNGKLLAATPFAGGRIYLVSPNGAIVARSGISPAGEFTLRRSLPGEYLVCDSLSHPLTVFELPVGGQDRPLELEMPVQSRTLSVVLSPKSRRRTVALELAGRVIPSEVLLSHQMARRLIHELGPGETLEFRDLGPGSLAVYSIPVLSDYPPEWSGLDPVEQPHLRVGLPRFPVTGAAVPIE